MTVDEMRSAVGKCKHPDYTFGVVEDSRGAIYLQASYQEPDTVTGIDETQLTRRWFLSPHMTKSEIVQTVFKCVMTSMEHRAREWFKYRGEAIFGPHFNVDSLHELSLHPHSYEMREEMEASIKW